MCVIVCVDVHMCVHVCVLYIYRCACGSQRRTLDALLIDLHYSLKITFLSEPRLFISALLAGQESSCLCLLQSTLLVMGLCVSMSQLVLRYWGVGLGLCAFTSSTLNPTVLTELSPQPCTIFDSVIWFLRYFLK